MSSKCYANYVHYLKHISNCFKVSQKSTENNEMQCEETSIPTSIPTLYIYIHTYIYMCVAFDDRMSIMGGQTTSHITLCGGLLQFSIIEQIVNRENLLTY